MLLTAEEALAGANRGGRLPPRTARPPTSPASARKRSTPTPCSPSLKSLKGNNQDDDE